MLTVLFAVIYLAVSLLINRLFENERRVHMLFYLIGLTFVVLIIPFQFNEQWVHVALGWVAMGVIFATYGILKSDKTFYRTGFIAYALSLPIFLTYVLIYFDDLMLHYEHPVFPHSVYFAITIGSLVIMGAYIYKKMLFSGFQKFFKYVTYINLWFYAIYISSEISKLFEGHAYYHVIIQDLTFALLITLTFGLGYFVPKIIVPKVKILADLGVTIISVILQISGVFMLLWLGGTSFTDASIPTHLTVIAMAILIVVSLLSVLIVYNLMRKRIMANKHNAGREWIPLIVSTYFVIVLTQHLIVQYQLAFTSTWISIIFMLTAFGWIIYGFIKRYSFIRKFGLVLSLLSVAKLFIIDLAHLTQGWRIISYFALGLTLVAISFVYQYFNKRLELQE